MIQPAERRIGNWVYLTWEPFKITPESYNYNDSLFDPILLTEDILLKCGFVAHDMADLGIWCGLRINDEITLSFDNGRIWIGQFETHTESVHQLQNLYFALTDTELEINF